jgi:hypothetical protein
MKWLLAALICTITLAVSCVVVERKQVHRVCVTTVESGQETRDCHLERK